MQALKRRLARTFPGLPQWAKTLRRRHEPIPYWYEPNFYQLNLQHAFRDLIKPGDVVFDVGANIGETAVMFSRLVGLRGSVCAFEASQRVLADCQHNLVVNGCTNVQLYHRAIYPTSRQQIKIYHNPAGTGGDSLQDANLGLPSNAVKTLALDDFVAHTGMIPKVIKMDIERSELGALQGMPRTLAEHHPHLILEEHLNTLECLALLKGLGYLALDLNTYQLIAAGADFPARYSMTDILFVHPDRLDDLPYRPPLTKTSVAQVGRDGMTVSPDGSLKLSQPLKLSPGRYIFHLDFTSENKSAVFQISIEGDGGRLYHHLSSNLAFQAVTHRFWVLHLYEEQMVSFRLDFLHGSADPTLRVQGLEVQRLQGFEAFTAPLLD